MPNRPKLKQPTSDELLASLLAFVEDKFYPGEKVAFAKDRRRLLDWVILFPASWLNERAVTVPADRYREIVKKVLSDAKLHGSEKITYRPAWLRQVIQSYFGMHGEEIYERAKAMRNLVDHALMIAGKASQAAPDPVGELVLAKRLLKASKGSPKRAIKPPEKAQLTLL